MAQVAHESIPAADDLAALGKDADVVGSRALENHPLANLAALGLDLDDFKQLTIWNAAQLRLARRFQPLSSFCSVSFGGRFFRPTAIISAAESHVVTIMLCCANP